MNLPISAVAALLVAIFLDLKTPEGSLRKKLARIDFMLVESRLCAQAFTDATIQGQCSHYFKLHSRCHRSLVGRCSLSLDVCTRSRTSYHWPNWYCCIYRLRSKGCQGAYSMSLSVPELGCAHSDSYIGPYLTALKPDDTERLHPDIHMPSGRLCIYMLVLPSPYP